MLLVKFLLAHQVAVTERPLLLICHIHLSDPKLQATSRQFLFMICEAHNTTKQSRDSSALLVVSWSKFKAAPTLKGPDGVLCILPSGSIIFVLWASVLSTGPHPAAFPGPGLALVTFGIAPSFSNIPNYWWIGGFLVVVSAVYILFISDSFK